MSQVTCDWGVKNLEADVKLLARAVLTAAYMTGDDNALVCAMNVAHKYVHGEESDELWDILEDKELTHIYH